MRPALAKGAEPAALMSDQVSEGTVRRAVPYLGYGDQFRLPQENAGTPPKENHVAGKKPEFHGLRAGRDHGRGTVVESWASELRPVFRKKFIHFKNKVTKSTVFESKACGNIWVLIDTSFGFLGLSSDK